MILSGSSWSAQAWTIDSVLYKKISVQREAEIIKQLEEFKVCKARIRELEGILSIMEDMKIKAAKLEKEHESREVEIRRLERVEKNLLNELLKEKEEHQKTRLRADNYKRLLKEANAKEMRQSQRIARLNSVAALQVGKLALVGGLFTGVIIYFTHNDPF